MARDSSAALWHIVSGATGCAFAVDRKAVAVVVDALRASATATMLLEAGALELILAGEVDRARAAKEAFPDALLFGERDGLPPEGFDFGNSPRDAAYAAGRRVVFTTTTGARRAIACWGAHAVYMGTTLNAKAIARAVERHGKDIVLIPAGLFTDPAFSAQEDWAAAAAIASAADARVGEGASEYARWRKRIEWEGLPALFATAPHARKLRAAGLEADTAFCAQLDIAVAVPRAIRRTEYGLILRNEQTTQGI